MGQYNKYLRLLKCYTTTCVNNSYVYHASRKMGNGSGYEDVNENSNTTVNGVLLKWKDAFRRHSISEPKESIEHIIAHVLGSRNISTVYKLKHKKLLLTEVQQIEKYCRKRMQRVPIQYVLEEWDFRDITLKMSPPVFIPRPETEILVDLVLNEIDHKSTHKILEFCCGSGAICVSILKSRPLLYAMAIDKSEAACKLTKLNADIHEISSRLEILHMEITPTFELIDKLTKYDVIVSNPPYVFERDMENLQPEIKLYEDPDALNGGMDGLTVIKCILNASSVLLNCSGKLFLEVDPQHPSLITSWLEENVNLRLKLRRIHKDFCNKERFVEIVKEK